MQKDKGRVGTSAPLEVAMRSSVGWILTKATAHSSARPVMLGDTDFVH